MAAYQLDKLIQETRRLAVEFRQQCGQTLPVTGELANYDAAQVLNLTPPKKPISGVDFIGLDIYAGDKIQIKSRVIFDENRSGQRIGKLNYDTQWDRIILVLYDAKYQPSEIYSISRETALANHDESLTRPMSVAKFKMLGELVWSQDTGILKD